LGGVRLLVVHLDDGREAPALEAGGRAGDGDRVVDLHGAVVPAGLDGGVDHHGGGLGAELGGPLGEPGDLGLEGGQVLGGDPELGAGGLDLGGQVCVHAHRVQRG
jgi:hypothetical protein